jgi:hypothetical protein
VSSGNAPASRLRAGAAETGQPERDLTEQGGDLVGAVILDLAGGGAGSAVRPSDRMVPALGCDDCLLDQSHKLLALRQGQAQIRNIAKITGAVDHHHVDASARTLDPGFHQAQNPSHFCSPASQKLGRSYPTHHCTPNRSAVLGIRRAAPLSPVRNL